jgi:hypothetical protein
MCTSCYHSLAPTHMQLARNNSRSTWYDRVNFQSLANVTEVGGNYVKRKLRMNGRNGNSCVRSTPGLWAKMSESLNSFIKHVSTTTQRFIG